MSDWTFARATAAPLRGTGGALRVLVSLALAGCVSSPIGSGSAAPGGAGDLSTFTVVEERPAVSVPVVLWFEDYNEVLVGTAVIRGFLERRAVDVQSRVRPLRCVGYADLLVVPPDAVAGVRCDGMRGESRLTCSDGNVFTTEFWTEETCLAGYGTGQDRFGHTLHSVFGGSRTRAETAVREALKGLAHNPMLPSPEDASEHAGRGLSTGTGFFVSWDGHLVTNHHVVRAASRVQVRLDDGQLLEAEIVTADKHNDLALLRVDAIREPIPLRRDHGLSKGQEVFALGYPLVTLQGQEVKANFGRVNALSGVRGDERFAQIDVPIQPGNSGGPLVNQRGEVVGVVTSMLHPFAVLSVSGVLPQNVNYALKSDLAHEMIRFELGSRWRPADETRGDDSFDRLISRLESSVVIVVAE